MARTKASVGAKLSCGKSSKAVKTSSSAPSRSSAATPSTSKGSTGGNSYHPRPTPKWQKPITSFFGGETSPDGESDEEIASGSKGRSRHSRMITSDTESDCEGAAHDDDLDASNVSLPPPSPDESSHKIVEYFEHKDRSLNTPHSAKGKGKGKRSVQPDENLNTSISHNKEGGNVAESGSDNKENVSSGNSVAGGSGKTAAKRDLSSDTASAAKRVRMEA